MCRIYGGIQVPDSLNTAMGWGAEGRNVGDGADVEVRGIVGICA